VLLFALPQDWADPEWLTFGMGSVEVQVTLSEAAVAEGTIDPRHDLLSCDGETAVKVATESVAQPAVRGWTGEWHLSGRSEDSERERTVRKMSVTIAGKTAFTAYGRAATRNAAELEAAWEILRCGLRPATATDG
jgi:hypothetical protein